MYGFPQAGSITNKTLHKRLSEYGFSTILRTQGTWRNKTRTIHFDFVVDDFGVEYERKEDMQYLLDALNTHYEVVAEYW